MKGEVGGAISRDEKTGKLVGFVVTTLTHLVFLAVVMFARQKDPLQKAPKRDHVQARLVEVPIKAGSDRGKVEDPSKVKKGPQTPPPRETQDQPETRVEHQKRYEKQPRPQPRTDPKEEIERLANIEKLAEQELDKPRESTTAGQLGTGDESQEKGLAKGAGGDKNEGITDPCALTFKQDVRSYRGKIQSKVNGFKRPSFISPEVAKNLITGVRVTFDTQGKIVSVSTASSSGNPKFDQAAEEFIRKLGNLDAPPKCVMFNMKSGFFMKTRSFLVKMKGR
jgi:TonB family protein